MSSGLWLVSCCLFNFKSVVLRSTDLLKRKLSEGSTCSAWLLKKASGCLFYLTICCTQKHWFVEMKIVWGMYLFCMVKDWRNKLMKTQILLAKLEKIPEPQNIARQSLSINIAPPQKKIPHLIICPTRREIPHFCDALGQLHGLVVPLFYRAYSI